MRLLNGRSMGFMARVLALTTLCFASGTASFGADLYNTLSAPLGSEANMGDYWPGISFSTDATNVIVNKITLQLKNLNALTSGSINLYIYDATGASNKPGSQVGSLFGSIPINTVPATVTEIPVTGLSLTLSTNTNYWVVLESNGLSGNYQIPWTSDGTGAPGSLGRGEALGGESWFVSSTRFWKARIEATPVPEPSTYALGAIASGVLAVVARRRRACKA